MPEPRLSIVRGPNAGASLSLAAGAAEWTIGRSAQCDLQLEDQRASRRHFRLRSDGFGFAIEDLGSHNGTLVNGQKIAGPQVLSFGDLITVGDVELRLDAVATPPPVPGVSLADSREDLAGTIRLKVSEIASAAGAVDQVDAQTRLDAVLSISESLRHAVSLEQVMDGILQQLMSIFPQADRAFALLCDGPGGAPVPRATRFRRADGEAVLSRTIIRQVIERGEAILSSDIQEDARFNQQASVIGTLRTLICVPLLGRDGKAIGAIQLDGSRAGRSFQTEDLALLAAISGPPAVAVENARLHQSAIERARLARELEVAKSVQQSFLPRQRPVLAGYEFADYYEAAGRIGGDYFDYIELPSGKLAVTIGDVSGKGVGAALQMARFSAEVRFMLATQVDPVEAIERLAAQMGAILPSGQYVTFLACLIDPVEHRVEIINAGHLPPLLVATDGSSRDLPIDGSGFPIGLMPDARYRRVIHELEPGASVVLFTDGVSDALNSAEEPFCPWGEARIAQAYCLSERSPQAGLDALVDRLRVWTGQTPQSDDICVVAFGRSRAR